MDVAYDHIQEEVLSTDRSSTPTPKDQTTSDATTPTGRPKQDLNTEFQETFRAFSSSPWGAKLGGFFGTVRKQGESYYAGARQEYNVASEEALKGFTDLKASLVDRTRSLSLGEQSGETGATTDESSKGQTPTAEDTGKGKERTESEILRENDGLVARFRSEATKRLKDIEKAEDAADEALLRFGTNIRNFLHDAVVSVVPPSEDSIDGQGNVLFESKDSEGKRVIHTTRFDAQLHAIHSSLDRFLTDPVSSEWPAWKEGFDIENNTEAISGDLEKYPDLKTAMAKLVPEKVDYADFWRRYYFLRLVIETEEKKRKELLKGDSELLARLASTMLTLPGASTQSAEEEVGWDEDSDAEAPRTPQSKPVEAAKQDQQRPSELLKPVEGRRSNDMHSQPDSDASYDLISGATSRAPGSPKDEKAKEKTVAEESDEEDWE